MPRVDEVCVWSTKLHRASNGRAIWNQTSSSRTRVLLLADPSKPQSRCNVGEQSSALRPRESRWQHRTSTLMGLAEVLNAPGRRAPPFALPEETAAHGALPGLMNVGARYGAPLATRIPRSFGPASPRVRSTEDAMRAQAGSNRSRLGPCSTQIALLGIRGEGAGNIQSIPNPPPMRARERHSRQRLASAPRHHRPPSAQAPSPGAGEGWGGGSRAQRGDEHRRASSSRAIRLPTRFQSWPTLTPTCQLP